MEILFYVCLQCDAVTTVAASIVSTKQSPLSVVHILMEGRCSLLGFYVLVNYNILYGVIQLFMTCYVNNLGIKFGDYVYLVQDLFFSLFLGLCLAYTEPSSHLSTKVPPRSLFHRGMLFKLALQCCIFPLFQFMALKILRTQSWYVPFYSDTPLEDEYATESSAINVVALAQLMIASVVTAVGEPHRRMWYTNKVHVALLVAQAAYILYLIFGADNAFMRGMANDLMPHSFGAILVAIILGNVIVSGVAARFCDQFI